jgi:hypothetical protein
MKPHRTLRLALLVVGGALLALLAAPSAEGRQKKPPPADRPRVVVAFPLGAGAGATSKLTLRGVKLDGVTEARCQEPKATARLIGKGRKVDVPAQQDANRVGDSQAEIELTLPADIAASTVTITLLTSAGETEPYRLRVDRGPAVAEKEPNNGFRQAQPVQVPQEIDGAISAAQDVDVFRFEGKAGQKLIAEVFAARHGSALDSLLTLYNADGQELASHDDLPDSTDSRLDFTLPRDGTYYLSVMDAHDQGGPAHVYRLSLSMK